MTDVVIAAFYKFVTLSDYTEMREPLLGLMSQKAVRGSILLAEEGVNGTIAGPRAGVDAVLAHLRSDARLADMDHKESHAAFMPFGRAKVRLKREIVTLHAPDVDPTQQVGTYMDPDEWNDLIRQPDVLLIDTRNDYEYALGTFEGAVNPNTEAFGEFPDYVAEQLDPTVHKRVAMFCTGGIRCEKATSFLLAQGFESVYHLRGGILRYLEQTDRDESLWNGECYVFDDRVTVDHDLQPGSYIGRNFPEPDDTA